MREREIIVLPPQSWSDPARHPELFDAIAIRRILAYLVDIVLVMGITALVWMGLGILGVLTLGLLLPLQALAVALVPLTYHIVLIASPGAATVGMRLAGIRVADIADGGPPSLAQAFIQIIAFFGSIAATASFILLVALFNPRRRTLHDFLAGTVVINTQKRL